MAFSFNEPPHQAETGLLQLAPPRLAKELASSLELTLKSCTRYYPSF
jgi:hypothetical protein